MDLPPPDQIVEVTDSGVRLGAKDLTKRGFAALGEVQVRKNMVVVHLNPAVSEALGYQPGGPTFLQPGFFGELEWTVQAADLDASFGALLDRLDWLVELSLLPVTVFD